MKMPIRRAAPSLVAAALVLSLAACSTTNPDVVPRSGAQQLQTVRSATVVSVREVVVDGSQSGVGAVTGAVVGGVAGASVGGHREAIVVGVLGALAVGALGNAIERAATTEKALELTLRMPDGSHQVLVQAKGEQQFMAGDAVNLIGSSGKVRVVRVPR